MATSTTRLGLREPDPSDQPNVQLDLNDNWDKVDAAVGVSVATSLPASAYGGKLVSVSTDSYRSYFSNGTTPVSASWVEIPNSSGTFGSDLKIGSGNKVVIGGDVNLYRSAANVLKTDDSMVIASNLTVSGSGSIAGALGTGPQIITGSQTVSGAGTYGGLLTANGGVTVNGDITVSGTIRTSSGAAAIRSQLSYSTTVANTTTETMLCAMTIPANDAVPGAAYRIKAWGTFGVTGTPSLNFRNRLGGVSGATSSQSGALTMQSGVTGRLWEAEVVLVNVTTGTSGTWTTNIRGQLSGPAAGTAPFVDAELSRFFDGTTLVTRDSTIANDFGISAIWSAASASNTITCQGFIAERVA